MRENRDISSTYCVPNKIGTQYVEEIFRILEENEENEVDENISYPKVKLRERLRMGLRVVIHYFVT